MTSGLFFNGFRFLSENRFRPDGRFLQPGFRGENSLLPERRGGDFAPIAVPDKFACGGDFFAEFRRLQDLDPARFAEDPADDLVFERGPERDDEGSGRALVISLSMKPGAMQLARMPRLPISLAIDVARPIKPAFDAE